MLRITSKNNGFRRCGVAHSSSPTYWPDDHFNEDELAILKAEPLLLVEVVDESDAEDKKPVDEAEDKSDAEGEKESAEGEAEPDKKGKPRKKEAK